MQKIRLEEEIVRNVLQARSLNIKEMISDDKTIGMEYF